MIVDPLTIKIPIISNYHPHSQYQGSNKTQLLSEYNFIITMNRNLICYFDSLHIYHDIIYIYFIVAITTMRGLYEGGQCNPNAIGATSNQYKRMMDAMAIGGQNP